MPKLKTKSKNNNFDVLLFGKDSNIIMYDLVIAFIYKTSECSSFIDNTIYIQVCHPVVNISCNYKDRRSIFTVGSCRILLMLKYRVLVVLGTN